MLLIYRAKENRKELVKALVTLTKQPPVYSGPRSYAYTVGDYVVDREGNITIPDDTDESALQEIMDVLEDCGFTCLMVEKHEDLTQDKASADTEPEVPEDDDSTKITLSFPAELFDEDAIDRMKAIVAGKQSLLKKALDTDDLAIVVEDGKVNFPWFTDHGIEGEVDAYSKLTYAIAKLALKQNRVLATEEKKYDDEKLAMRLFLIRLNFVGDEYKSARAILMRNFMAPPKALKAEVNLCMPEVTTTARKNPRHN